MQNTLLRWYLFTVDIGFIIYWTAALFDFFPGEWLFNNYHDPIIVAWNWSFFPLDIIASMIGLTSLYLYRKKNHQLSTQLATISLSLVFCAGIMAVSFWVLTDDYSVSWWATNLYLAIPAVYFLYKLLISGKNISYDI